MDDKLTLSDYQKKAQETDQYKEQGSPQRLAMPFLGLVEDAGDVSRIYKEVIRSGDTIRDAQRDELEEKLGDILWFLTNIAEKAGLELNQIAKKNIKFTQDRWHGRVEPETVPLHDEDYPPDQQLPRKISIYFRETPVDSRIMMFVKDENGNEIPLGDKLNDNAYEDDGYRYHDVLHLAYYALLGWSPVMRALLKKKRKQNKTIDEVEDGARAALLEEAVTAYIFQIANTPQNRLFESATEVDTKVLKTVRSITRHLEVKKATLRQWERAILKGYEIFRQIKTHKSGSVTINLLERTITYSPPTGLPTST
ncbi:MAG: nucleoside triphosphate pyrophosphohydrolase family protein [Polyangia bacterium]